MIRDGGALPEIGIDDLHGLNRMPPGYNCECTGSLYSSYDPGDDDYAVCLMCGLVYVVHTVDAYDANDQEVSATDVYGPNGYVPGSDLAEARRLAGYAVTSGECYASWRHGTQPPDLCPGLWPPRPPGHVEHPLHDILPDGFRGALQRCFMPSGHECAT